MIVPKTPTHVVVDAATGETWAKDKDNVPFTLDSALAFARALNATMRSGHRTFRVMRLQDITTPEPIEAPPHVLPVHRTNDEEGAHDWRLRVTFWVPTQYAAELDPAAIAVQLRDCGWQDAADTADRIARGEIEPGEAMEMQDGELAYLARAIRKAAVVPYDCDEPVDTDEAEDYHIYVGEEPSP